MHARRTAEIATCFSAVYEIDIVMVRVSLTTEPTSLLRISNMISQLVSKTGPNHSKLMYVYVLTRYSVRGGKICLHEKVGTFQKRTSSHFENAPDFDQKPPQFITYTEQ